MRPNITIDEDFFDDREVENRVYSPTQRRTTQQHRRLIEYFGQPTEAWSHRALHACLETLARSTVSEAWCVGVVDAWAEDESAFCVLYRYREYPHILGIRRSVNDYHYPGGEADIDPAQFGQDVATGDIGEPLGTVAHKLKPDTAGVHWWGSIGESLPSKNTDKAANGHRPSPEPVRSLTTKRDDRELSAMNITNLIVDELRAVNDWVSIADLLKVMGTTSFVAGRDDVRRILDCVDASDRLRLGRVSNRFDEIPKPIPVAALVDRIFGVSGPSDRSAAMMELFIAEI
ncbi:hypothetical protein [Rhodococcus qingshengii]|jgi:hypothetical protein|uniref:hypothetical protein n=1 Tax=Rhodococcus qingshengii TaxID=334542 RepID=UPI002AFE31F8|nr:hypothetical protein [Rhodococcus qingshengii]MEA1798898.1 hypothetical protein [Rhodococcus qingshengii]